MQQLTTQYMNALAERIFLANKEAGWWDDPDRCVYTCIQLIITEIAEATEGERKNLMDDHLKHRKMGEVELADAMIRAFDLAGRFGWKYIAEPQLPYSAWCEVHGILTHDPDASIGKQHLAASWATIELAEMWAGAEYDGVTRTKYLNHSYTSLMNTFMEIARRNDYDVFAALEEKLEYNAQRQDHKREVRAAEGGKKF